MNFQAIAKALGIEVYPQELETVYENLSQDSMDICNIPYIEALEEEYQLFGEYFELVKSAAGQIKADEVRRAWGQTVCTFLRDHACLGMPKIPVPESDGSLAADMLPLLILLPLIPQTVEHYRAAGIEEEAIRRIVKTFGGCIKSTELRVGRPGVSAMYYNWQMLYIKVVLLPYGSFNFELRNLPKGEDGVWILKNRTTGEILPVMNGGTYHRSGMVLGSAGFEDSEGAFTAEFNQTEDAYIGHPAINNLVSNAPQTYPKSQWECVLEPGDLVISVHIPKGADLSPEAVERSYREGMALIGEKFPQYAPKCLFCSSWLMDPALEEMLGSESKIAKFLNGYVKFPISSAGREVYSFVFVGFKGELEDLPENTRLERALKKKYLAGEYIHAFRGVQFLE